MDRITENDLAHMCNVLNDLTDNWREPYRKVDGKLISNVGCYYISQQLGGWRLEQMCPSGGSRDISQRGTKREIYRFLRAYIDGITVGKECRHEDEI
jgi:hypothetical protein